MIEGSALEAMTALRAKIEERLLQTEDYRAMRALEKAIADVGQAAGAAVRPQGFTPAMPAAHGLSAFAGMGAPMAPAAAPAGGFAPPPNPVADQHGMLQQRMAERFNETTAA